MPRYSKALTPAAQRRFLEGLRRGLSLAAAAGEAGVQLSSLYCRRKRDPELDAAWDDAVAESRSLGDRRRLRLKGLRREIFLKELGLDCRTCSAARAAGVHKATVYRLIGRDPGFARDNGAALERGYDRLEAQLAREQAERAERLREAIDRAPKVPPSEDFDHMLKLLDRYRRSEGSIGPRRWRGPTRGETLARLEKKLEALGWREREGLD